MKINELPTEIKKIIPSLEISEKMYLLLWNRNNDFIKNNTLEYDVSALVNFLKKTESEAIKTIETKLPFFFHNNVSEIQKKLISFFESIYDIEDEICGNDYLDDETMQRIGINSNMRICEKIYYTYAACYHCYSKVNKVPSKYIAYSPCYRIETKQNKFRRNKFHMFEVVEFDKEEMLEKQRYYYIYIMVKLLEAHGINNVRVIIANDSFVTDNKQRIAYQMLTKSKVEIQVFSKYLGDYIAVSSINMHYKHFIQKFEILCSSDYNSMCFGVGLERLREIIIEEGNKKYFSKEKNYAEEK